MAARRRLPLDPGSAGTVLRGDGRPVSGWVESVEERAPGVASVSARRPGSAASWSRSACRARSSAPPARRAAATAPAGRRGGDPAHRLTETSRHAARRETECSAPSSAGTNRRASAAQTAWSPATGGRLGARDGRGQPALAAWGHDVVALGERRPRWARRSRRSTARRRSGRWRSAASSSERGRRGRSRSRTHSDSGPSHQAGGQHPTAVGSAARRPARAGPCSPSAGARPARPALTGGGREPVGRRAQHEAGHLSAVAVPEQLGDRAAHRVADRDHRAGAELRRRGRRRRRRSRRGGSAAGADAPAVAAVVEGQHAVVPGQRRVAGEPVEVGAGGPARAAAGSWVRPGGPGSSRTNVVPRPGSSTSGRAAAEASPATATADQPSTEAISTSSVRRWAPRTSTLSPALGPMQRPAERRARGDDLEAVVPAPRSSRRGSARLVVVAVVADGDDRAGRDHLAARRRPRRSRRSRACASSWRMRPSIFPCSSLAAW